MKKAIFLGILLTFVLAPVVSIRAENLESSVAGCLPSYAFSPLTGQPCSGDLPVGCMPGYLFSSVTGKSCTEVSEPTNSNLEKELEELRGVKKWYNDKLEAERRAKEIENEQIEKARIEKGKQEDEYNARVSDLNQQIADLKRKKEIQEENLEGTPTYNSEGIMTFEAGKLYATIKAINKLELELQKLLNKKSPITPINSSGGVHNASA